MPSAKMRILHTHRHIVALGLLVLPLTPPARICRDACPERGPSSSRPSARPHEPPSVKGRITEKESGQPIMSVQVVVVGNAQRIGAITDANGDYTLRGVPAGTVTRARDAHRLRADGSNRHRSRRRRRHRELHLDARGHAPRRSRHHGDRRAVAPRDRQHRRTVNADSIVEERTDHQRHRAAAGAHGRRAGHSDAGRHRLVAEHSHSRRRLAVAGQRAARRRRRHSVQQRNRAGECLRRPHQSSLDARSGRDRVDRRDQGPSAAALYGTAAANGVVIIKTKKGRAGSTKWSAFVENGVTQMPGGYPSNYWTLRPQHREWRARHRRGAGALHARRVGAESVRHRQHVELQSVDDASMTDPFKNGPTSQYGFQATGGSNAVALLRERRSTGRYRPVSRCPTFEQNRITTKLGEAPRELSRFVRTSCTRRRCAATSRSRSRRTRRSISRAAIRIAISGRRSTARSSKACRTSSSRRPDSDGDERHGRTVRRRHLLRGPAQARSSASPVPARSTGRRSTWLQLTAEGGVDNANSNNFAGSVPGRGSDDVRVGPDGRRKDSPASTSSARTRCSTRRRFAAQATRQLTIVVQVGDERRRPVVQERHLHAVRRRLRSRRRRNDADRGGAAPRVHDDDRERDVRRLRARAGRAGSIAPSSPSRRASTRTARSVATTAPRSIRAPTSRMSSLKSRGSRTCRASIAFVFAAPSDRPASRRERRPRCTFLSPLTYPAPNGDVPGPHACSRSAISSLKPEVTTEYEGGFDMGLLQRSRERRVHVLQQGQPRRDLPKPLPPSFGAGADPDGEPRRGGQQGRRARRSTRT